MITNIFITWILIFDLIILLGLIFYLHTQKNQTFLYYISLVAAIMGSFFEQIQLYFIGIPVFIWDKDQFEDDLFILLLGILFLAMSLLFLIVIPFIILVHFYHKFVNYLTEESQGPKSTMLALSSQLKNGTRRSYSTNAQNSIPDDSQTPLEVPTKFKFSEVKKYKHFYDGKSGIYIIRLEGTINAYTGQSNDLGRRWNEHVAAVLKVRWLGTSYLYNAILKYGIDKFTIEFVEIIDSPTVDLLYDREGFWMTAAEGNNHFNIRPAGKSVMLGRNHTDATKAQMAVTQQANKEQNRISQPNRIELLVVDTLVVPNLEKTFYSIREAASYIQCDHSWISKYLRKNRTDLIQGRWLIKKIKG